MMHNQKVHGTIKTGMPPVIADNGMAGKAQPSQGDHRQVQGELDWHVGDARLPSPSFEGYVRATKRVKR